MAKIRELMVTEMIAVRPGDTVAEAVRRMTTNKVGALLVVEDGKLCGLLSERDVLTRVVDTGREPNTTRVADVATPDVVTINVDAPLKAVLQLFREKGFRHLPVADGGKPVGILSTRDFLAYVVEGLERFIDEAKYARDLVEGIDPYDHIGGSYGR